jgi:hypothetical protein
MSDWTRKQKERQKLQRSRRPRRAGNWLLPVVLLIGVSLPLLALGTYFYQNEGPQIELEVAGNTITVRRGGDFQAALGRAKAGDTILLEAGATFVGSFVLPKKSGNEFITIQTTATDQLPPAGTRVGPKDAASMPKILSSGKDAPALRTEPGAHHYRFVGVEFSVSRPGDDVWRLVYIGDDAQKKSEDVPHNIVFERCYVHAHQQQTGRVRSGLTLNGRGLEVLDSYIAGFRLPDDEGHGIVGWNGPGPFRIVNNYIEAAGINVLFGGAFAHPGMNPADLEFRRNHLSKPLDWRGKFTVKNLFELKDMRRALIEENVFENNWASAQDGTAIVLTPASLQSGPDARVEDIVFRSNVIRRTANAISMTGTDYGDKNYGRIPVQNSRVRFENNFFGEISRKYADGSAGRFLLLTSGPGPNELSFDHNTIENEGTLIYLDGGPVDNFIFTNNTGNHNEYGVFGSGKLGTAVLQALTKNPTFRKNVIAGAESSRYPVDNFYTAGYRGKGTDGKDIGADLASLAAMEKKVVAGLK